MSQKYPIVKGKMLVALDSKYIYIPKEVFVTLFENSQVYYLSDYKKAISDNRIRYSKLRDMSREANIPYSLFFAPKEVVERNIQRNNNILFQGVPDGMLLIAGRGNLRLNDVGLIIKDIQKRQMLMTKYRPEVKDSPVLSITKNENDELFAKQIINALGLDMEKFRAYSSKNDSYQFLTDNLERNNIMISRSRKGYMPQSISPNVAFSGLIVKDKKFPTIFLHARDEDMVSDPSGRRIFTVFLLLSCMANRRFVSVSYDQGVKEVIKNFEYRVAEEMLVPRSALEGAVIGSIDDIKKISDYFKVTPSMALMRLKRTGLVSSGEFDKYFDIIKEERKMAEENRKKGTYRRAPKITTGIVAYNSKLFCREVIRRMEAGKIGKGEARRLLVFNKRPFSAIRELVNIL